MSGFVCVQWLLPDAPSVLLVPQPGPGLWPLALGVVRRQQGHCYNTKEHNPRALLDVAPGSAWLLLNPAKDATRLS